MKIQCVCIMCGIQFFRSPSAVGQFCSRKCRHDYRSQPEQRIPLAERFWEKVKITDSEDGCWEWKAGCLQSGYGSINSGDGRGSLVSNRVAWELTYGDIPEGLYVLHKCDNRKCCRPTHLFLGTKKDNTDDMLNKKRHIFGEASIHAKLNKSQIVEIRDLYGRGVTMTELAHQFDVTTACIHAIVNFRSWKIT